MFKTILSTWYKLSIKSKQLIFFTFVIFCVSLFSFYSLYNMFRLIDKFKDNITTYFQISRLQRYLSENELLIGKYLENTNMKDLHHYNESVDAFQITLEEIERRTDSLETYFLIRAIKNTFMSYYDECNAAIKIRKNKDANYYIHHYKAQRIRLYIESYIQQLLEVSLAQGNQLFNQLASDANVMELITLISILFITLICIVFGLVFSNYLTGPIKKLAAVSAQMSQGNLDVQEIQLNSGDEVGVLAKSFNAMSKSIKTLVNDLKNKSLIEKKLHQEELKNVKMQQLLKEAKFLALQSQINPHFLFNTLNTISRIVMFGENEEATGLIEALSDLLRYNLGDCTKYVTLKQELDITRQYLFIQKYRFGDRIKVDIQDNNVDIENILIPSFTLQPLVENAIIHGLEPKEEGGSLRIKVKKKGETAIIKLIDNGTGIPKKRLHTILSAKDQHYQGHTSAIGISNVLNRLLVFCNNRSCFNIRSTVGRGTVITIQLKIMKGDRGHVQIVDCR